MPLNLEPARESLGQGDTGGPVDGTGTSVPGGIDSIFEFNGLYMNIRSWWDTYLVTGIDGLDDADVRDARDVNPNDHGETAYDNFYGGRNIVITGRIRAFSLKKLRDLHQAMRQAFGDLEEHPLIIRSGDVNTNVTIMCKKNQKLVIKEEQTTYYHYREFQLSLRASKPFFLSYLERNALLSSTVYPAAVEVVNMGNYPASPKLVIQGPIKNPTITNVTTGQQMLITGSIAAGTSLTLDVFNEKVYNQLGVSKYSMLSIVSDWIKLNVGSNTIQLTGTEQQAGVTNLRVSWNDTWV